MENITGGRERGLFSDRREGIVQRPGCPAGEPRALSPARAFILKATKASLALERWISDSSVRLWSGFHST